MLVVILRDIPFGDALVKKNAFVWPYMDLYCMTLWKNFRQKLDTCIALRR